MVEGTTEGRKEDEALRVTICGGCGRKHVDGYVHVCAQGAVRSLDACLTCGAVVLETTQHNAWHRAIARLGCSHGPAA